jgi:hypothetical protein
MAGWMFSVSSQTINPQPRAELVGCFEENDDSNLYLLGAHAFWYDGYIAAADPNAVDGRAE